MSKPTIHIGRSYDGYTGRVDQDAGVAYATATNDPNGVYLGGETVPPLYTVSLLLPAYQDAQRQAIDPGAIREVRGGMAGEHDVRLLNPVRPGMEVQWCLETRSARQTPGGVLVTHRAVVSDQQSTPLVEHLWSSFRIGGIIDSDLGPDLPDHSFPAEARHRPLGSHTFEVTDDQAVRFAAVSQNDAPHSLDEDAARQEGLPGRILQGLCTFSMCSGAVVQIAAGGDPTRVRRLAVRYASPVFLGGQLVVHLYDAGLTDEGGRAVAFEATQSDSVVIKHGRAELHRA